jgi:hypothetical protein
MAYGYYFTSGSGVCLFLAHYFAQWGFSPYFYRSSESGETFYIRLLVPEGQQRKVVFIRLSDHQPVRRSGIKPADYEVALTAARKNATGYPRLLKKLADLYHKEAPSVLNSLLSPENYGFYRRWQQRNALSKAWRPGRKDRLYFPINPSLSLRNETA